jgi:hypothetical protein
MVYIYTLKAAQSSSHSVELVIDMNNYIAYFQSVHCVDSNQVIQIICSCSSESVGVTFRFAN